MSTHVVESAICSIDKKLKLFSPEPFERCIFRVPDQLRNTHQSSYDPKIIAIGPYHHGKDQLTAMEEHKTHYLKMLLHRKNEDTSRRYVEAIAKDIDKARRYYEKSVDGINAEEFVEMMVLDGCFVIEFIRKDYMVELRNLDKDDPVFKRVMTLYRVKLDLLLLENQLPYFVLQNLFEMTVTSNDRERDFVLMIMHSFKVIPGPGGGTQETICPQETKHLLGLIHDNWLPPKLDDCKKADKVIRRGVRSATKLQEAGVKLRKQEESPNIFDIKYENGVLNIPQLIIGDETESIFRNMIAYELYSNEKSWDHIIDYCLFMDSLINTPRDVELLSSNGIISNFLGNEEAVAHIFNRICDNIVASEKSYYTEVCTKVNNYCSSRWNEWMAKLKHDYFNSPWAWISFVAAFFLLVFTLLQTLYTIISYYHR